MGQSCEQAWVGFCWALTTNVRTPSDVFITFSMKWGLHNKEQNFKIHLTVELQALSILSITGNTYTESLNSWLSKWQAEQNNDKVSSRPVITVQARELVSGEVSDSHWSWTLKEVLIPCMMVFHSWLAYLSPSPRRENYRKWSQGTRRALGPNNCTLFIENTRRWWEGGMPCTASWPPRTASWAWRALEQPGVGGGLPVTHWPSSQRWEEQERARPESLVPRCKWELIGLCLSKTEG